MFKSIQCLRAAAAWLVVCHHFVQIFYQSKQMGTVSAFFGRFGGFGVDLFFVISGFVISHACRSNTQSPLEFAKNRAARIIPAYWIFTSATVAMLSLWPGIIPFTAVEPVFLLKSLFFVPALNPSGIGYFPVMTVGWTLNCEIAFYAAFGLSLFLARPFRLVTTFALVTTLVELSKYSTGPSAFYANPMIFEFLLGMLVYAALPKLASLKLSARTYCGVVLLSCVCIYSAGGERSFVRVGLPFAAVLISAVALEPFFAKAPVIARLGDWSYSTYLVHVIVLSIAYSFYKTVQAHEFAFFLGSCLVIALFSALSFKFLESPVAKIFKHPAKRSLYGVRATEITA